MADPGELNLKPLSISNDPILIVSIDPANPTIVHVHEGGTNTVDLPVIFVCNTAATEVNVKAMLFSSSATVPNSVIANLDLLPGSGAVLLVDGPHLTGGRKIGISASIASVVTAWGRVPRATL